MLRADKRNSCSSSDGNGEMERGATYLLRRDKGQRDKLFGGIIVTVSVQSTMSLQHCSELYLLSRGVGIKLSRTSAGSCHIGCVSFPFRLQQFMARCLVPKTPHGRVDKVKNYDCHQSQNPPIPASLRLLILNGSLMRRWQRLVTQKRTWDAQIRMQVHQGCENAKHALVFLIPGTSLFTHTHTDTHATHRSAPSGVFRTVLWPVIRDQDE